MGDSGPEVPEEPESLLEPECGHHCGVQLVGKEQRIGHCPGCHNNTCPDNQKESS